MDGAGVYNEGVDAQISHYRGEDVEILDLDEDGRIDTLKVTFSENVLDATLYTPNPPVNFWQDLPTTRWVLAGRGELTIDMSGPDDDANERDNNVLYFTFAPAQAGTYDTGDTPDLSVLTSTLTDEAGNLLQGTGIYQAGQATVSDHAKPVLVGARGNQAIASGEVPTATEVTLTFSEPVTDWTATDLSDLKTSPDGAIAATAPAFGGIDIDLTIDAQGRAVLTLNEPTASGGAWTEDATIEVNTGRVDHCIGDLDSNDMVDSTPAVQIRGLGSVGVASVEALDTNANGYLDAFRVTFDRPVDDTTLEGYSGMGTLVDVAANGNHWQIAGRDGFVFIDPNGPLDDDVTGNTVLYLVLSQEGGTPDTGTKPALTVANALLRSFDNEPVDATSVPATTDSAAPQIMTVIDYDQDSDGDVDTARLEFSENMDDSTIQANDFTIGAAAGAAVDQIYLLSAVFDGADTACVTRVRHSLANGDVVGGLTVTDVLSITSFEVSGNLSGSANSYVAIASNDDGVVFINAANGAEENGTDYADVGYTQDLPTDADTTDLAGILLANTADAGLDAQQDGAPPVVLSAKTTSENSVEVTFSEPVGSFQTGEVTADGGNITFDNPPDTTNNPVIVWQNGTDTWNTGATDAAADAGGTNASGVDKSPNTPDLTIDAGALADLSTEANPVAAVTSAGFIAAGVADGACSHNSRVVCQYNNSRHWDA